MGKEIKKRVKGFPEANISQGSNHPSHGPSFRANSCDLTSAVSVDTLKKYSTRYVYATRCNPNVVELLLNNSKNKALRMSRNRAHILPVKKQQCTGSLTSRGVNKDVDHRSYAQVVSGAEARPAKVGNSNIPDKAIGVDHNQGGTCGIDNGRHKGVR